MLLAGCDPEGHGKDMNTYHIALDNTTTVPIDVTGYRTRDLSNGLPLEQPQVIESLSIPAGEKDAVRELLLPFDIDRVPFIYPGFENNVDSIVVKFDGMERGYITTELNGTVNTERWITGKSSLLHILSADLIEENGVYYYRISESDQESAFDL